jgi:hypothetical protein
MMVQVFWASWKFEFSKVCEIWMRYKLHAYSLLWCLSLDFLALHIYQVLLLGFMIIKLHASSPLWYSSLDFLALHYFHVFILASFIILTIFFFLFLVGMLGNLTPPQTWTSSYWFFTVLKKLWPTPSCVLQVYTNIWLPSFMFTTFW